MAARRKKEPPLQDFRLLKQILHVVGDVLRSAQNITNNKEKSTMLPQANKPVSESPIIIALSSWPIQAAAA